MDNKNELDLKRVKKLLNYLKRNKLFILLFTILGFGLGVTYSLIKKPVYTAKLTFSLQEENKTGGSLMSLASSFGLDLGSSSGLFSGENIEQVFKSRNIVERTLFQPYPNTNHSYGDEFLHILKKDLGKENVNLIQKNKPSRFRDSMVTEIYEFLGKGYLNILRPDKKYDIYQITMKSKNENFSLNFTKELLNQVSIFYTETKTKKAKSNVDVLQARVDSIHRALGGTLYKRAEAVTLNLNPTFQTGKVQEQQKSIDVNALGTGYGELLKNLELAKYSLLKETPLFQVIDEPKFPLDKKTYKIIFYAPLGAFLFFIFSIGLLIVIKTYKAFIQNLQQA